MILTSIIISLFCCGWRIVTDEGQLLYFIRKPFAQISDLMYVNKDDVNIYGKIAYHLGKPFILCITCMSSFWGVFIYFALHHTISIDTLICCVMSAFLNNVFYFSYDKYLR